MILGVQRRLPVVLSLVAGAALSGCTYPTKPLDGQPPPKPAPTLESLDTSFTFYAKIGHKAAAAGDHETAIGFYRRAIQRDNRTTEAHVGLGQAYAATGRYHEAASAFRTALRQDPENKAATLGLATAHLAHGSPEDAAMLLSRNLETASDPAYFNQLGLALDLLGRYNEAEEIYRRGLEHDPDHPGLRNNLAMSMALAGQYKSSEDMLRTLSSNSRDASLLENKDLVARAESKGDAAEANESLRENAQLIMAMRTGGAEREELVYHKFDETAWRSPATVEAAFGEANMREGATFDLGDDTPPQAFSPQTEYDIPFAVASNSEPDTPSAEPMSAALAQESELVPVELKQQGTGRRTQMASRAATGMPSRAVTAGNAFQVQLGSFRSSDRARSYWATVSLREPKLLDPVNASVERTELGASKGTVFRLRTEPISGRAQADRLCSRLKARSIDCLVVTYHPEAAAPANAEPVASMTPSRRKGT